MFAIPVCENNKRSKTSTEDSNNVICSVILCLEEQLMSSLFFAVINYATNRENGLNTAVQLYTTISHSLTIFLPSVTFKGDKNCSLKMVSIVMSMVGSTV